MTAEPRRNPPRSTLPAALGGTTQFADFFGTKAYSNRKVGKLAADALANSKHAERVVITPAMLDGASVTV